MEMFALGLGLAFNQALSRYFRWLYYFNQIYTFFCYFNPFLLKILRLIQKGQT